MPQLTLPSADDRSTSGRFATRRIGAWTRHRAQTWSGTASQRSRARLRLGSRPTARYRISRSCRSRCSPPWSKVRCCPGLRCRFWCRPSSRCRIRHRLRQPSRGAYRPSPRSRPYLAAGASWRCGLTSADALAAARMTLPLGIRLAAGTSRSVARAQLGGSGRQAGMIPGPRRDTGEHLPPGRTGTEATLFLPRVARGGPSLGTAENETEELLPTAERCLAWLRTTVGDGTFLCGPQPGGPVRPETQAHAHRAALLGADLLDACARPGGAGLREWGRALRSAFRKDFWLDGLGAAGRQPPARRTVALCRTSGQPPSTCSTPACWVGESERPGCSTESRPNSWPDSSAARRWGLRGLGVLEAGYNPFGHRGGAVRVHETAVAVAARLSPEVRRRRVRCYEASSRRPRPSATGCPRCTPENSEPTGAFRFPTPLPAAPQPRRHQLPCCSPPSSASVPMPRRAPSHCVPFPARRSASSD